MKKDRSENGLFDCSKVCCDVAEMRRFERPRRGYRPFGFRIRPLQPLGYISEYTMRILYINILKKSILCF